MFHSLVSICNRLKGKKKVNKLKQENRKGKKRNFIKARKRKKLYHLLAIKSEIPARVLLWLIQTEKRRKKTYITTKKKKPL
jgi:hypothetical protein